VTLLTYEKNLKLTSFNFNVKTATINDRCKHFTEFGKFITRISGPTHDVIRFIVNSYFFPRLVLGWFLKLGTQRLVAHPSKLIFHDRSDMRHFILSNLLYFSQCRCCTSSHSVRDTHSVGFARTSDRPFAEAFAYTTRRNTRDKHPCPQRDSNPGYQQSSSRKPTP
jgi:hypothetical protein